MVSDFRKDAVLKLANSSEVIVWFVSRLGVFCPVKLFIFFRKSLPKNSCAIFGERYNEQKADTN
jgi:hypothetical protein